MFSTEPFINTPQLWALLKNNGLSGSPTEIGRAIDNVYWLKSRKPHTLLVKAKEAVYAVYKELRKDEYLCIAFVNNAVRYVLLDARTSETSVLSSAGFISLLTFIPPKKD